MSEFEKYKINYSSYDVQIGGNAIPEFDYYSNTNECLFTKSDIETRFSKFENYLKLTGVIEKFDTFLNGKVEGINKLKAEYDDFKQDKNVLMTLARTYKSKNKDEYKKYINDKINIREKELSTAIMKINATIRLHVIKYVYESINDMVKNNTSLRDPKLCEQTFKNLNDEIKQICKKMNVKFDFTIKDFSKIDETILIMSTEQHKIIEILERDIKLVEFYLEELITSASLIRESEIKISSKKTENVKTQIENLKNKFQKEKKNIKNLSESEIRKHVTSINNKLSNEIAKINNEYIKLNKEKLNKPSFFTSKRTIDERINKIEKIICSIETEIQKLTTEKNRLMFDDKNDVIRIRFMEYNLNYLKQLVQNEQIVKSVDNLMTHYQEKKHDIQTNSGKNLKNIDQESELENQLKKLKQEKETFEAETKERGIKIGQLEKDLYELNGLVKKERIKRKNEIEKAEKQLGELARQEYMLAEKNKQLQIQFEKIQMEKINIEKSKMDIEQKMTEVQLEMQK